MSSSQIDTEFHRLDQTLQAASASRKTMRDHAFPFGIDYLDDCTNGVFRNDLILLGAQTGRGKTQAASLIALNAAAQGKNVFYFALEAERYEIERRLLFSAMGKCGASAGEYMSGHVSPSIEQAEAMAMERLSQIKTLWIYYKKKDFGTKELEKYFLSLQNVADCFIVDHFHFIDYDVSENEIAEHKRAIRMIRDTALDIGRPVILLAHLNKAFARSDRPIPGVYDFYGTSDLANVCTKGITISGAIPEGTEVVCGPNESPTVIYVSKNRTDNSVAAYAGICVFSHETAAYREGYDVFDLGRKAILSTSDRYFPRWARRARPSGPPTRDDLGWARD